MANTSSRPPYKAHNADVDRAKYSTTGLSGSAPMPNHSWTMPIHGHGITNGNTATTDTPPKTRSTNFNQFSALFMQYFDRPSHQSDVILRHFRATLATLKAKVA